MKKISFDSFSQPKRLFHTLIPILSVVFVIASLLSGCSFLPTEDEPLAAPLLNPYEQRQLTLVAARRDDLVQTKTISCRSRPVREQSYSFPIGGMYIERVYFSVGDPVKAGDMLAELERKEILSQVEEARIEAGKQENALRLAKDATSLYREILKIQEAIGTTGNELWENMDAPSMRAAVSSIVGGADQIVRNPELNRLLDNYGKIYDEYIFGVSYAEKKLEIAQSKLDILVEMADERVIYATIDGVVSYAQRFTSEDRSVAGERAFTVSDASELIYVVSGDDAQYFTPGERYSMKVSKSFLEMRAVSPQDYGEAPGKDPVIYFVPEDLSAGLASYGYISVETDRRNGALYLPAAAIIQVGENHAVYRVGSQGLRELAPVKTGVTITGKTEILSGLEEGDEVILD